MVGQISGEIMKYRRELHKRMINGQEELWDEYCRLHKEVKHLKNIRYGMEW